VPPRPPGDLAYIPRQCSLNSGPSFCCPTFWIATHLFLPVVQR